LLLDYSLKGRALQTHNVSFDIRPLAGPRRSVSPMSFRHRRAAAGERIRKILNRQAYDPQTLIVNCGDYVILGFPRSWGKNAGFFLKKLLIFSKILLDWPKEALAVVLFWPFLLCIAIRVTPHCVPHISGSKRPTEALFPGLTYIV